MKKGIKIIIGFIVLAVIGIGTLLFFQYQEDKNYKERGESLISKIEEYRKQKGELPNSLFDLGIAEEMGEGPYYEKKTACITLYILILVLIILKYFTQKQKNGEMNHKQEAPGDRGFFIELN
jgi:hypothetical protein